MNSMDINLKTMMGACDGDEYALWRVELRPES